MIIKLLDKFFKKYPTSSTNSIKQYYNKSIISNWTKEGKKLPAPHVFKQSIIQDYQKKFNTKVLVESGTYLGDMIFAQLPFFDKLNSIELVDQLWEMATKRFENNKKVSILKGDSGRVLHDLVPQLSQPTLFWLDGHFSGGDTGFGETGCPIYAEIDTIFASPDKHIILIDDARCFIGAVGYPPLAEFEQVIKTKMPNASFEVKDDIIRIVY